MTVFYSSRPLRKYKPFQNLTIASVAIETQYHKQSQKQLHAQIISNMFKNILPYQILKPAMHTWPSKPRKCVFLRMGNTSYLDNVTLNEMVTPRGKNRRIFFFHLARTVCMMPHWLDVLPPKRYFSLPDKYIYIYERNCHFRVTWNESNLIIFYVKTWCFYFVFKKIIDVKNDNTRLMLNPQATNRFSKFY